MTMKLPIILSAMIAALAVPGTFASEAPMEPAKEEAAAAPEAAAHAATEHKPEAHHKAGKKKYGHHKGKHHKGKHHVKKHSNHDHGKWDQPYDQVVKEESSSCGGNTSDSGMALPMAQPGHKGPEVDPAL